MEPPLASAPLTETAIEVLINAFYGKVRVDPHLGPVFATRIEDESWPAHLAIICDFWSTVMLRTGRYRRNPFSVHLGIEGLRPEHFDRWLALFHETCRETLSPEAAEALYGKAVAIGDSLKAGLFFRPELARRD